MKKKLALMLTGSISILGQIACRPVMTIGWQEIAIIFVIALIVFGPMLWRLYRLVAGLQGKDDDPR